MSRWIRPHGAQAGPNGWRFWWRQLGVGGTVGQAQLESNSAEGWNADPGLADAWRAGRPDAGQPDLGPFQADEWPRERRSTTPNLPPRLPETGSPSDPACCSSGHVARVRLQLQQAQPGSLSGKSLSVGGLYLPGAGSRPAETPFSLFDEAMHAGAAEYRKGAASRTILRMTGD